MKVHGAAETAVAVSPVQEYASLLRPGLESVSHDFKYTILGKASVIAKRSPVVLEALERKLGIS